VVLVAVDPGEGSNPTPKEDEEEGGAQSVTSTSNYANMNISPNAKKQIAMLEQISQSWAKKSTDKDQDRTTVFVWMDGRKWGKWLKSMYGINDVSEVRNPNGGFGGGVGVVVVDHSVRYSLLLCFCELLHWCAHICL
jgi:hypothetical protein